MPLRRLLVDSNALFFFLDEAGAMQRARASALLEGDGQAAMPASGLAVQALDGGEQGGAKGGGLGGRREAEQAANNEVVWGCLN